MDTPKEYTEVESQANDTKSSGSYLPPTPAYTPSLVEDGEIDLFDIVRQVWDKKKTIIITVLIFLLFGIFVAVVSPEEYTSEVVLMPQSNSSSSGASGLLRQFGGLAGVSLGGSPSGNIGIDLYPDITQSTPFFLHMMDQAVFISNLDTTVVLKNYVTEIIDPPVTDYIKRYTIGLPKLLIGLPIRIIKSFQDKPKPAEIPVVGITTSEDTVANSQSNNAVRNVIKLTGQEKGAIGKLSQRIATSIEDNGTLRVTATMPDPYAAARATELSVDFLTNYLIEYKTEKSKSNLSFLEEQYEQAQSKYFRTQQRLAQFRDRNSNIVSARAQTELERLESENQLTYQVYQGLAQQLEQARITVQEETPIFKVLEPIQVPLSTSSPNRELIIFIFAFLGIFTGFAIVVISIIYRYIEPKLKATEAR